MGKKMICDHAGRHECRQCPHSEPHDMAIYDCQVSSKCYDRNNVGIVVQCVEVED